MPNRPMAFLYAPRMGEPKRRDIAAGEQRVLDHGHLRLLATPEEVARSDQAIRHHYIRSTTWWGSNSATPLSIAASGWPWPPGVPLPFTLKIAMPSSGAALKRAGGAWVSSPTAP